MSLGCLLCNRFPLSLSIFDNSESERFETIVFNDNESFVDFV